MIYARGRCFTVPRFDFWRCLNISTKELQINEEIRDKEIRVISNTGEQLGIMSSSEALKLAEQGNFDLVKIAPQAKPPVCKIMDYGKYRFEQAKREKEAKKNQRVVEIKEIRLSSTPARTAHGSAKPFPDNNYSEKPYLTVHHIHR